MKKISPRSFSAPTAKGAAAKNLSGSLPVSQAGAADIEYKSPTQMPFSLEREKANQTIALAPKPQVLKVRDHVYTAVSYALATMILVETSEGSVIIDTTESLAAAHTIMGEFRKITGQPVKAVIYTQSLFNKNVMNFKTLNQ